VHKNKLREQSGKVQLKTEYTFADTATIKNICFPRTHKWLEHKDRISKKLQIFRSRFRDFCRTRYFFVARFKKLTERKLKISETTEKKLDLEQTQIFLILHT
jgi:hypothetical protein